MARCFKDIKVVKDVETINIFKDEDLRNVVINSNKEAMSLNNFLKKTRKGKENILDHSSNSI